MQHSSPRVCSVAQSCLALCNPWTGPARPHCPWDSPWVGGMSSCRGSSPPRDGTCVSCISCTGRRATWEIHSFSSGFVKILLFLLNDGKKRPFPNPPPQARKFRLTVRCQYPSAREKWLVWSGQCSGSRWPWQLAKHHSPARSSTCCLLDPMASCQNWMLELADR